MKKRLNQSRGRHRSWRLIVAAGSCSKPSKALCLRLDFDRINSLNYFVNMGNSQPKVDPKEVARQNKRMMDKAVRTIEREQKKMQAQEKKLLAEIKVLATKNQHGPAKIMAKDLVRTRAQIN